MDAVLQDTIALLGLVSREADALDRLRRCVGELEAIRRARVTLAGRTVVELVEAGESLAASPSPSAPADRWEGR